jgi:asparagine synthase (glutamine-hydrolysing)
MSDKIIHRGPDSSGYFVEDTLALGFRRLAIIDLENGDQPLFNESQSIVLVCNGEIFNYVELREKLTGKGHVFRTRSDIEVLVHLYEERGVDLLDELNGQFAFVIYDRKARKLFLARDQFGICPLYYAVVDDIFIFASEVKAILAHPLVRREVDLTGLDQTLSFPGRLSPRTMFKGVKSLMAGHYLTVTGSTISEREYWDLCYPRMGDSSYERPESYYTGTLSELLSKSVKYRLQADVPVGCYLSGGLDSSLVAAMIDRGDVNNSRHSFSVTFTDKRLCESRYQRMMSGRLSSVHHEIIFDSSEIASRLAQMVYHGEGPVKESFNTCSLALSEAAQRTGVKVILAGEGADELFAGYLGYRFDQLGGREVRQNSLNTALEYEMREVLWGDKRIFYETDLVALNEVKKEFYSTGANEIFDEFDCLNWDVVNKDRLKDRHAVHQRSYLDFKLRLSDHLIKEHGDKMILANSVEGRYPFLDIDLVEFATTIPPDLKLNQFTEKYILKKVARDLVPHEIIVREKCGFRAPGSPQLLRPEIDWISDLLSYERIKRQGYFNPETVERLKRRYSQEQFDLHPHLDTDLLMVVLTFNIFLDAFHMPDLN